MEESEKRALRESRVYIRDHLILQEIWDPLVASHIFTQVMLEIIESKNTRVEKVRQLLQDLERRPPPAFTKFLDILDSTGHEHCANFIRAKAGLSIGAGSSDPANSGAPDIISSSLLVDRQDGGTSSSHCGGPEAIQIAAVSGTRAVHPMSEDEPGYMEIGH